MAAVVSGGSRFRLTPRRARPSVEVVRPRRHGGEGEERDMRRSNLMVSGASAAAGALALLLAVTTDGNAMVYLLGGVLLTNAFVRYQLAQREER